MTIATIREKLHDYINVADEDKVKAIYTLLEEQIQPRPYEWSEDESFVAELDERYERYEKGIDKSISLEEFEISIEDRKTRRENGL